MPVILGCLDLVTFVAWHLIANPLLGCVTGGDGRDSHCTCHPASVSLEVSSLGTHGMTGKHSCPGRFQKRPP